MLTQKQLLKDLAGNDLNKFNEKGTETDENFLGFCTELSGKISRYESYIYCKRERTLLSKS